MGKEIITQQQQFNADATFKGNVTVTSNISAIGNVITVGGNSTQWNSAYTNVNSNSASWNSAGADTDVRALTSGWVGGNSAYTTVKSNSADWDSVYTTVNSNSASYATISFANSKFLPLTGGTITGNTRINADLTVYGNISATGNSYFANTVYSTTSALSVINIGNSGPALYIGNNGSGDIASFYDIDQGLEVLHIGGNNGSFPNVGVKVSNPNKDFTVKGELSASNTIWDSNGNSNEWNSAYTTVNTNSGSNWNYQGTDIKNLSGGWVGGNSAYTTVNSNSANWNAAYGSAGSDLSVRALTGNWQNTFNTVQSNSATTWNYQGTDIKNLSSGWVGGNSAYTTVNSNSANYILVGGNTKGSSISIGTNDNFNLNLETNNVSRLTILSSGNVGIGTTNPNEDLTVVGNISATGNLTNDGNIYLGKSARNALPNGTNNPAELTTLRTWTSATDVDIDNLTGGSPFGTIIEGLSAGHFVIGLRNNDSSDVFSILSQNKSSTYTKNAFTVMASSGNVGIGTTNPNEDLTVVGNISATGNIQVKVGSKLILNDGGAETYINRNAAVNGMEFFTASASRMFIDDGGNVGIGTADPNEKLTVVGNISASGNISSNGNVYITSTVSGGEGKSLQITNNVDSSLNTNVAIYLTPNSASGNVRSAAIKSFQYPLAGNNADLRFYTSNFDAPSERMIITPAGNVGIGTSTPNEDLTVVGNISATGNITANGQFLFADGTVSAPSIANVGDTNNGIYFPNTDTLGFVNNGAERLRIDTAGLMWNYQPAPTNFTGNSTLSLAHLQTRILTCSSATAITLTLPASSVFDSTLVTNSSFEFTVINYGTSTGTVTLLDGTGVAAPDGATLSTGSPSVSIGTSAGFRIRKTSATTFVTYRIS